MCSYFLCNFKHQNGVKDGSKESSHQLDKSKNLSNHLHILTTNINHEETFKWRINYLFFILEIKSINSKGLEILY